MARLASVKPGDEPAKALVEQNLTKVSSAPRLSGPILIELRRQRLKQWFTNRAAATDSRREALAWSPLLQRIHQVRNTRPRQRTAVQQFMRDYAHEVKAAFAAQYGDGKNLSSAERMNFQHDTAKELLHKKYPHLVSKMEEAAKAQHTTNLNEWDLILKDISLAEDPVRCVSSASLLYI